MSIWSQEWSIIGIERCSGVIELLYVTLTDIDGENNDL